MTIAEMIQAIEEAMDSAGSGAIAIIPTDVLKGIYPKILSVKAKQDHDDARCQTWEDYQKNARIEADHYGWKMLDVKCPECGSKIYINEMRCYSTYPQKYEYKCDCGWSKIGY